MFVGPFEVAAVVGLEGGGHEQVIAGAVGLVGQRRRQTVAGANELAAAQVQLGETGLGLLGGGGGQFAEAAEPAQYGFGVGEPADFLVLASQGQKVIVEIEGRGHGAASMQRDECAPHTPKSNTPPAPDKLKRRSAAGRGGSCADWRRGVVMDYAGSPDARRRSLAKQGPRSRSWFARTGWYAGNRDAAPGFLPGRVETPARRRYNGGMFGRVRGSTCRALPG